MLIDSAGQASRVRMRVEKDAKERVSVKGGNPVPKPQ
jgi:hypothetical protein